jgi:hypothetical protein
MAWLRRWLSLFVPGQLGPADGGMEWVPGGEGWNISEGNAKCSVVRGW